MGNSAVLLRTYGASPAVDAWFGNAAKMRIIGRITDGLSKTVLDYGAGTGAAWAQVLPHHPEIDLVCFEPDPKRASVLRGNVPVVYDLCPSDITERFDIIVSFSVLEHVYRRGAYLTHCYRLLKPGGTLFLNYDNGHFRSPGSRMEAVRNLLAPILPYIGMVKHYQASVLPEEADRLVAEAGFAVVDDRYENLPAFKAMARTATDRAAFGRLWLDAEARLNELRGADLWRVMGSRTLELVKRASATVECSR
jgi:2-polyprenyl-6-hydroxyphenyl methylase/3-demethylubiquinone-9 3-methyltransferase